MPNWKLSQQKLPFFLQQAGREQWHQVVPKARILPEASAASSRVAEVHLVDLPSSDSFLPALCCCTRSMTASDRPVGGSNRPNG